MASFKTLRKLQLEVLATSSTEQTIFKTMDYCARAIHLDTQVDEQVRCCCLSYAQDTPGGGQLVVESPVELLRVSASDKQSALHSL